MADKNKWDEEELFKRETTCLWKGEPDCDCICVKYVDMIGFKKCHKLLIDGETDTNVFIP